jgi:antitoxin HicB
VRFEFSCWVKPASAWAVGETGFVVGFRDLPECHTQGETIAAALSNAVDCLDEAIAGRIAQSGDIPAPSRTRRGERLVAVPAQTAAKAALYLALRQARISKSALARRLNCDEKDIRRLLDPRHGSKLKTIAAAMAALGKNLVVDMRDAA